MANLLDLAQKMGVSAVSNEAERKTSATSKRRPWLEEENDVEIDNLKIKKGELKKPIEPLKKLDEKLEKVEIKTDLELIVVKVEAPTVEEEQAPVVSENETQQEGEKDKPAEEQKAESAN